STVSDHTVEELLDPHRFRPHPEWRRGVDCRVELYHGPRRAASGGGEGRVGSAGAEDDGGQQRAASVVRGFSGKGACRGINARREGHHQWAADGAKEVSEYGVVA